MDTNQRISFTDQQSSKPASDPLNGDSARPGAGRLSFDEIDAYIHRQLRRLNTPGAALAIVEGAQIVYLRGYGRARPDGEAPTPQTPFFIGSLTKSFTALAVMQLVEAGKVELDAPVQRYLPWFRVADPQASAQMTVRHLLNQTSGLSMIAGMDTLADFDARPGSTERQARALSSQKLHHPPGEVWQYSNLNYNLLGLVIETASGETYEDYVRKHIFSPLQMTRTYTSKAEMKQNGLAVGHRYWFGIPIAARNLPVPLGSLPSGQLISTTEDLSHYLIAHLNGGLYGDGQILSSAGIEELHRGTAEFKMLDGLSGRYGMGWFEIEMGQTKTFSHGGNVPDFSAFMALIPEQKRGVVLLLNADNYGLPPILEEVGMGLTALLAGQQPPPIQLGFIPWLMRLLLLIPVLQIAGVAATLRSIRRWRQKPQRRPSRSRLWGRHILLPLIPNLTMAALPLFLRSRRMHRYLRFYNPDVFWISLIGGAFAGGWAFLRTVLILRSLRKRS